MKSVHTVEKYLRHLEEAFLLFGVRRFSPKVREQRAAPRKVYATDVGLVTSGAFRAAPDRGKLCENVVAIALQKQELAGECELFYWQGRQQEEVDFVVKRGSRVTALIQVCLDPGDLRTRSRETRALLTASAETGCDDLLVLTAGTEGEADVSWYGATGRVRFVPAWKWLSALPA